VGAISPLAKHGHASGRMCSRDHCVSESGGTYDAVGYGGDAFENVGVNGCFDEYRAEGEDVPLFACKLVT